jgi:hypothetical protein
MNRIQAIADRLRHPGEYPVQRARRRYLEELEQNGTLATTGLRRAPRHPACGERHLPFEACRAATPRAVEIPTPITIAVQTAGTPLEVARSSSGVSAAPAET